MAVAFNEKASVRVATLRAAIATVQVAIATITIKAPIIANRIVANQGALLTAAKPAEKRFQETRR